MSSLAPQRPACRFQIARDNVGHWIARDRDGLAGGVFLNSREAMRFALFEVRGDAAQIYLEPDPPETV